MMGEPPRINVQIEVSGATGLDFWLRAQPSVHNPPPDRAYLMFGTAYCTMLFDRDGLDNVLAALQAGRDQWDEWLRRRGKCECSPEEMSGDCPAAGAGT